MPQMQSILANLFGRPIGKIFLMPLEISSWPSQKVSVYLALENFQLDSESQKILDFIFERSETMSITIDRLMLEYEHSENAFRWERTFDSLERPIAIIDSDYEILRANKKFADTSYKLSCHRAFADQNSPCAGCPMSEALTQGKPTEGTVQIRGRVYQVNSYPILSDGGAPNTVVNSYVDITQSRELYLRLLQSEKMGALGVLAGNIAHELNNPLTGLRSLTQVLLKETKPEQPLYADLVEIEKATARSQKIIQNLQEFSAHKSTQVELFNLDEVVERTMPMLKTLFRNHRLEVNLETPDVKIKGEPSLIQQVIFNLINNACQAMKKPGTLSIETTKIEGNCVQLIIADTGGGITEQIGLRIFEPFYTTKAEGSGTGLGLSLAKEIVERHGGKIYFKSQVDQGTQFFVIFPISSK
jgi:nitrogen-specific signal transduction histidine kinase